MDAALLQQLTPQATKAAESAADFIRSQVGKVHGDQVEAKERNSLVSYVDKEAERILVEALRPLVPDPGFMTEEDTIDNTRNNYTWIIDPLDGTTNFLQQIPVFAVSVGLAYQGEIVYGCVVDIMQNDTYYAWKGGGAWVNGKSIRVSSTDTLEDSIIATGFPYYSPEKLSMLTDVLTRFLRDARGVRRLGAAALDMAYVACGRFDAFYETTLNPWDIAGGTILVREAGGTVTDFTGGGDFVSQGEIVASNGKVHQDVLEIVRGLG